MFRRTLLLMLVLLTIALPAYAGGGTKDFRFGILREISNGKYEIDVETTRIPRKLKGTGFRFGVAFENFNRGHIEWHEVMYSPSPMKEVSGTLYRVNPSVIQTDKRSSSDAHIVDDFWFDSGDPLGVYRMEVFVNGIVKYSVDFEVVEK
jgi:hypothetical protein